MAGTEMVIIHSFISFLIILDRFREISKGLTTFDTAVLDHI